MFSALTETKNVPANTMNTKNGAYSSKFISNSDKISTYLVILNEASIFKGITNSKIKLGENLSPSISLVGSLRYFVRKKMRRRLRPNIQNTLAWSFYSQLMIFTVINCSKQFSILSHT